MSGHVFTGGGGLKFDLDLSSIPRVFGWTGADWTESAAALRSPTVPVTVRPTGLEMREAYIEVGVLIINGVPYRGGRVWATLVGGGWQLHRDAGPRLSAALGTYGDATASAARAFRKVAERLVAQLDTLPSLHEAQAARALVETSNMRGDTQQALQEAEQRLLELHTTLSLLNDLEAALADPLTAEQHRHMLAFRDAGHSWTDAAAAARVIA